MAVVQGHESILLFDRVFERMDDGCGESLRAAEKRPGHSCLDGEVATLSRTSNHPLAHTHRHCEKSERTGRTSERERK